eukprot:3776273-Rhodomonas_salina.1
MVCGAEANKTGWRRGESMAGRRGRTIAGRRGRGAVRTLKTRAMWEGPLTVTWTRLSPSLAVPGARPGDWAERSTDAAESKTRTLVRTERGLRLRAAAVLFVCWGSTQPSSSDLSSTLWLTGLSSTLWLTTKQLGFEFDVVAD